MSVTRQSLKNSVRSLCGESPDLPLAQGGLPDNLIWEELTSIETEMLRDLDLSSQSRRVASTEVSLTPDQEQFAISVGDFHAPAFAYLQTANSTIWTPVEIIDHAGVIQAGINGTLAVSVVGTTGYTSWIPDTNHTLRFWYERNGMDDPALAESTELGNLYDEYLKLQTAAQCKEHMGLKIGDVMIARLAKSERQWQRYVNRGRHRGQGTKNPVFLPYRLRRSYPFVDRTRFFLPR